MRPSNEENEGALPAAKPETRCPTRPLQETCDDREVATVSRSRCPTEAPLLNKPESRRFSEARREENIALLWARESMNGRSFRRRVLSRRRPEGFDFDPFFREVDISTQQEIACRVTKELGSFAHYASFGFLRKPLPRKLREERTRLIALSLMQYDERDDQHRRVLEEVIRVYAGKEMRSFSGCDDRLGKLGFGGTDDVPIFQSGGLLTLWMMLYLHRKNKEIALDIFRGSKVNGTQFRFAALCDLATGWVLRAIKKRKLNALVEDMDSADFNNLQSHMRPFEEISKKLFVGFVYKFHDYMQQKVGFDAARKNTERYLTKRDLGILVRIADIPDILCLNEELFVRPTFTKRIRDVFKVSCGCGAVDGFSEYEEL